MGLLDGRVVVVTGGASGIGRATVRRCLAEGARVIIGDIQDPDRGDAGPERARCVFQPTDVSIAAQVSALMQRATSEWGRLDVLVAAAGIGGGSGEVADYAEADFDQVIAINLKGVFLCMKYAIPEMLRSGGGAVVNVASIAGLVGLARTPAYCAAKGGVVQLTKVAALDYANRNIRVNCVCPAMIDTPMVRRLPESGRQQFVARQPLSRLGSADEVAAAAVFLASDQSAFTTGAALAVDGGFTAQ